MSGALARLRLRQKQKRAPTPKRKEPEIPGVREYYNGQLRDVKDPGRIGWWRFNEHYDRDGYCDNPARGY